MGVFGRHKLGFSFSLLLASCGFFSASNLQANVVLGAGFYQMIDETDDQFQKDPNPDDFAKSPLAQLGVFVKIKKDGTYESLAGKNRFLREAGLTNSSFDVEDTVMESGKWFIKDGAFVFQGENGQSSSLRVVKVDGKNIELESLVEGAGEEKWHPVTFWEIEE